MTALGVLIIVGIVTGVLACIYLIRRF